mgnify:CR=1 FL=1
MKILIVSDSHGLRKELKNLTELHADATSFIHCGDSELDHHAPELEAYRVVRGNCDYAPFPNQLLVEAGDERILVTHGHLYGVKNGLLRLKYVAQENEATIVCFGHSHVLGVEQVDRIWFMNPGSLRYPRLKQKKTYLLLELTGKEKKVTVFEYPKNALMTIPLSD